MARTPKTSTTAASQSRKAGTAGKAVKAPKPPAPWCKRLFRADAESIWSWYSALQSTSLARRSVNELWRKPSRNVRKRQLFADDEMRRRILGIKKGQYVALKLSTVARIVAGWAAARRKQPREAAPVAAAVEAVEAEKPAAPVEAVEPEKPSPVELVDVRGELVEAAPTDPALVAERLAAAQAAFEMPRCVVERLRDLHTAFEEGRAEGILVYEMPVPGAPPPAACIFGWSKMLVSDPNALNAKVRDLVLKDQAEKRGVWTSNYVGPPRAHTDPTWKAYTVLRKVGCKPRLRGPANLDPGHYDMLYYREWTFTKDVAYEDARARMAKSAQLQTA